MLKKLALALLSCMVMSAYAKMTPTRQQTEQLYQAVEQALPANIMMRTEMLELMKNYMNKNSDDMNAVSALSSQEIKHYKSYSPEITQCIINELNKKSYQKPLQTAINNYFNQATPEQFKHALEHLTDPQRVNYFNYTKQRMELLAKHADVLEEYFKTWVETDEAKLAIQQLDEFAEQSNHIYLFMNDIDLLTYDDEFKHIADLLGVSIIVTPWSSSNDTQYVSNPMSVYQQSLIDDCHKPFWQEIKQGKYSDHLLSP